MPLEPGMPAPDFRLPGSDGEPHGLSELTADGPALLIFFRTGCPTCRLAFPVYGELSRRYGDAAAVVGVSQDPVLQAAPWLRELGFPGPALDDCADGYAVSVAYDVQVVPTLVMVGPDATVTMVGEGWDRDIANGFARSLGDATGRSMAPVSTEGDGLPLFKPG
ncbi:MAG: TlpA family protein disulfide reductase [Actinobacteria bacterium]|nr:TlpA family protein disulfide reductase [Actinomycetota bacterium]